MLELLLKSVDSIVEFIKVGNRRDRARFEQILKPAFDDLEKVHADYLTLLAQCEVQIQAAIQTNDWNSIVAAVADAAAFATLRRVELEPLRDKLRSLEGMIFNAPSVLAPLDRQFLLSVISYFHALPEQVGDERRMSVATLTISELSQIVTSGRNPRSLNKNPADVEDRFKSVTKAVENIRTRSGRLSSHWKDVCSAFIDLRLHVVSIDS